eukprot:scaffold8200_cov277-Pinguiococcus_pyrenoidosus.AAC.8
MALHGVRIPQRGTGDPVRSLRPGPLRVRMAERQPVAWRCCQAQGFSQAPGGGQASEPLGPGHPDASGAAV